VHLVGFTIGMYHDARTYEREIHSLFTGSYKESDLTPKIIEFVVLKRNELQ
jgi:hypothetical protein